MTWALRRATAADVPDIMAIEHASFPTDAWSEELMLAEVTGPNCEYFVAVAQDDFANPQAPIAGYAGLLVAGEQADLQTIAVREDLRGRGIGRLLAGHVLARAQQRGAREIFLEVRADNPVAEGLYTDLGFTRIAVRRNYYQPDGVDAHVMQRPLTEGSPTLVQTAGKAEPLVLGIETSCDETGVGIVRGSTLLANAVASSMDEHARFGGVVPEIAARAHVEAIESTIAKALGDAQVSLDDLDAIAVTAGPGLGGALMVGVAAAKALSIATGKPLYAVNHLAGHVAADIIADGALQLPAVALLVSGGHTSLLLVRDLAGDIELLGETIDDAAGEAFDKVARLLGLGYPGGPAIDRMADQGDPSAIRFPRGLSKGDDLRRHRYDFSFSGLKTAVARWVENRQAAGLEIPVADVAAGFREAVADVLTAKAIMACQDHGITRMLLAGGVAANARVRNLLAERCAAAGVDLVVPPLSLCTDNGAMIAALGARLVQAGNAPSGLDFGADSSLPVTTVQMP